MEIRSNFRMPFVRSDQCEKTNENTNSVYNVGLLKKQKYSATQGQWGTTLRF